MEEEQHAIFEDVLIQTKSGDELTDYGYLYDTNLVFDSRDNLIHYVRDIGKKNRMVIVIIGSKGHEGDGSGSAYVQLACEKSLQYRRNTYKAQENKNRQTGTKRCGCPFRLSGKENVGGSWRLSVINGNHNHNFPEYNVGRSIISRLNKEEEEKVKDMSQAHVKPSHILVSIQDGNKNNLSTLKQIYNFKQKLRREEMQGRTIMEQLLKYLNEKTYIYFQRVDENTNVLNDLFFANKRAVEMLRSFYFVLIIDCTYKTNKYHMPLLQITGCVPTGKNFAIGFAFLNGESKESFEWALQCVKTLFDPNKLPNVIVTDREFALIHAIDDIFPESYHMLCIRHIAKNIEAKVLIETRSRKKTDFFVAMWTRVVNSETEEDFTRNKQNLYGIFSDKPKILKYVQVTWMPHAKKFVKAFTNKNLHLGNYTTNRVESAHNALKRFIETSTGSLDLFWKKLHSFLQLQDSELKGAFVRSENIDLHVTVLHLLSELGGRVSHLAIKKIVDEYARGHEFGYDPDLCGCILRTAYGLPCAHELQKLDREGKPIQLSDIHVFWRTLHMKGVDKSSMSDNSSSQFTTDDEKLKCYFDKIISQPPELKKVYVSQLEKILHLESNAPKEPVCDRKTKGRPRKSSTKREPSYFEHVDKKVPKFDTKKSSSSRGQQSPTNEKTTGLCLNVGILRHMEPYILEYKNVLGDGHCGYRSVAHHMYGYEDHWTKVRKELYVFIESRLKFWAGVWHVDEKAALKILQNLNCYISPCKRKYWMQMDIMGPVIATFYNVILVSLDSVVLGNVTYLPLFAQEGITAPTNLIAISYLRDGEHFIPVTLRDGCPTPHIWQFWEHFHNPTVEGWDKPLALRVNRWKRLQS